MDKYMPLRRDPGGILNGYEVHGATHPLEASLGRRISDLAKEFSLKRSVGSLGSYDLAPLGGFYIDPTTRRYRFWWYFIVLASVYSSMVTPFQFGFFRGLPRALLIIDLLVQIIFVADIVVKFFTAYKDTDNFQLIVNHRKIALRYVESDFLIELIGCLPWDIMYKAFGHREGVRYVVWLRLYRVLRVDSFFDMLEKDIRFNYFAVRILKLLAVLFYCTHTAACIAYYLATTVQSSREAFTWIGSLVLGDFSYANFRALDLGKRYVTSLYWAVVTMATVGYGDIHAVNVQEMIFVMTFISFNMILSAYILGNMTALIVRGSPTESFRDKMTSLIKFMTRNQLSLAISNQMTSHVLMQFDSGTLTEEKVMKSLPSTIRSQVAKSLYSHILYGVAIFRGCSSEFLDEIVSRVSEENFLPGEVVVHQGGASDQFYIVCHGALDEVFVHEDGKVDKIQQHKAGSIFGEVGVLCNIPQPFKVSVCELCRLLRLDKHSFTDLVGIYFNDGRQLINNLLEWKDTDVRMRQIAADVTFLVAKQAAELALMVNNASYQGDLVQLKHLVKQGAIVAKPDYDGRTALHLAASRGFDAVVLFIIREDGDINAIDKFGITPLLEAVKAGHDHCMSVLVDQGAELHLQDPGSYICNAVINGNNELLRRLLLVGADPSAADYDKRTALHIAAAEGNFGLARMLIDAGADIYAQDRWGRTALDEAMHHDHQPLIPLLKEAAHKRKHSVSAPGRTTRLKRAANPQKGRAESETRIDEGERLRASPTSSSSRHTGVAIPPRPPRPFEFGASSQSGQGQSSGLRRQSSSEKRFARYLSRSGVGRGVPPRSAGIEAQAQNFRMTPFRQGGQPAARSRRRVSVFPFHPWTPLSERTAGKVIWIPPNIQEILNVARQYFGKEGTTILNQDGAEIAGTDFIHDAEKVYIVDHHEALTGPSRRS